MKTFKIIVALFSVFYSWMALPHPHLFVDSIATLEHTSNGEYLIKVEWVFDHWHSQGLIMDFDGDGDGKLKGKENSELLKGLSKNLSKYGHFAKLTVNGKMIKGKTSEYKVVLGTVEVKGESGKMEKLPMFTYSYSYRFNVPSEIKKLVLEFYDDTLYSAIASRGVMKLGKGLNALKNTIKKDLCVYSLEF